MSHNNHNKKKKYMHLSAIERGQIEILLEQGYSQSKIAQLLNRNKSTISREIKRGSINQKKLISGYKEINTIHYYGETAHILAKKRQKNSYGKSKLDKLSKSFISTMLSTIKQKIRVHSIDTFVYSYKQEHPNAIVPCTKTIYNWIHKNLIPLKPIDLPRMVRIRKKSNTNRTKVHKRVLGTSIDNRPEVVNSRITSGHWEIDLVIGQNKKSEHTLMTLVERKTRFIIIRKLRGKSSEFVNKSLKSIFKQYGKRMFQSITADNGSEFALLTQLESYITKIYFAHPFSSYERGTNENHNGLIREFIPKGVSLNTISKQKIQNIQNALNDRPRRILNYQTPSSLFKKTFECTPA